MSLSTFLPEGQYHKLQLAAFQITYRLCMKRHFLRNHWPNRDIALLTHVKYTDQMNLVQASKRTKKTYRKLCIDSAGNEFLVLEYNEKNRSLSCQNERKINFHFVQEISTSCIFYSGRSSNISQVCTDICGSMLVRSIYATTKQMKLSHPSSELLKCREFITCAFERKEIDFCRHCTRH